MWRRFLSAAGMLVLISGSIGAAEYALTGSNTTVTFIGTKPNGKHDGGFKTLSGTAVVPDDDLTKLKIDVEIDTTSLYSDNPKLTNHLKSPDFFGVKTNPTSKFVTTKVERDGAGFRITGDLTLLGKTNSIMFPAQIAIKGGTLNLTSKFTIDRTQWGMTYGQGKVDNDVTLGVKITAKK